MTFIYLERCVIHRDSNAITATDERGTVHIPAAALGTLLLGPGTSVSHQAMVLLAESGSTAVWVGEEGVRYYAHGRSLAHSSKLLEAQAALVSNQSSRLRVAREMYSMRFPGEDTSGLTMQQLRGREGARIRKTYREHSKRTGVPWAGRDYDVEDFESSDAVNMALSAANTSLYGAVHSVIVALGCSPGLGFAHMGHVRSFVYDIADLYKAELTIPLAFDLAAEQAIDLGALARRSLRDRFHGGAFLDRCVRDIQRLLLPASAPDDIEQGLGENVVRLWDGSRRAVAGGTSYADSDDLPW